MRRNPFYHWRHPAFIVLSVTTFSFSSLGQNKASLPATDSIQISNIQAEGDLATGQVQITMDFTNNYHQEALVFLVLGGFDGLGLVDNKGNKYKIHTTEQLINTADINKGFINIASVRFGDKTFKSLTFVDQKIPTGESRQLTIRIPKVATSVTEFNELYSHRQVSINYGMVADNIIKLQDIKIHWQRSAAKSK